MSAAPRARGKGAPTQGAARAGAPKKQLWEEAGQEYDRALQIAPNYADIRCRYAQVLLEMNNLEGAECQRSAT